MLATLHWLLAGAVGLVLLTPFASVEAAAKNKGLLITPLREYVTVDAGKKTSKSFTVANLTEQTISVSLSVKQFSVEDYSYDYHFKPPAEQWVTLGRTEVELAPNKSEKIAYQINVPSKAAPGGHYYTLFATTSFGHNSIQSQVQAATVLYVTVAGEIHKTSTVRKTTLPLISLGKDITFLLDVQNTGNTHFFTHSFGTLQGLGSKTTAKEVTRLLLPGTTRTVGGIMPAPLLPGLYKANFGYRTDANQVIQQSKYMLYLPLWSLTIPPVLGWIIFKLWHLYHRKPKRLRY